MEGDSARISERRVSAFQDYSFNRPKVIHSFAIYQYQKLSNKKLKCDLGREKSFVCSFSISLFTGWSTCPIPLRKKYRFFPMLWINEIHLITLTPVWNYHCQMYHLILLCILKSWRNHKQSRNKIVLNYVYFWTLLLSGRGEPWPRHLAMNAPSIPRCLSLILCRLQAADCIIPPCTSNPLIPQIPVESVKPVSCGLLDWNILSINV